MEPVDLYILSLCSMIAVIGVVAMLNNRTRENERNEKEKRIDALVNDLVVSKNNTKPGHS